MSYRWSEGIGKTYPSLVKLNKIAISFFNDQGNPLPLVVLKSIIFWQASIILVSAMTALTCWSRLCPASLFLAKCLCSYPRLSLFPTSVLRTNKNYVWLNSKAIRGWTVKRLKSTLFSFSSYHRPIYTYFRYSTLWCISLEHSLI